MPEHPCEKAPFVWTEAPSICPDCAWPRQNFQNLSGPLYTAFFLSRIVRIGRIWPKIATEEAGDLRNARIEGLSIKITMKTIATIDRQPLVNLVSSSTLIFTIRLS